MFIMPCPYRPDCANYKGKRDLLNWRSEVTEVYLSLFIRFHCRLNGMISVFNITVKLKYILLMYIRSYFIKISRTGICEI